MSWSARRARLKSHRPGRALLGAAALAYGAGVRVRGLLYELRILKRRRVAAPVICIGNLTTGGTGKTPAVLLAAETLRGRGHDVAILSRGYGGAAGKNEVTVLRDGRPADWRLCGDEPWMIHQSLRGQGVPVLVCPDRAKAGELAVNVYASGVLILDDGFQHLKLHRDLDIVLVNARDPFGGGRLLPLGDLREPLSALRRAQLVIVTHADRVTARQLAKLRADIDAAHPSVPILESAHKADHVLDVRAEKMLPLSHLRGKAVVALSGLGDPLSFESSLKSVGAEIAQSWRFDDHHAYTDSELRSIAKLRGGLALATTHKDFARFPENWRQILAGEVLVLAVKLELLKGRDLWTRALDAVAGPAPGERR